MVLKVRSDHLLVMRNNAKLRYCLATPHTLEKALDTAFVQQLFNPIGVRILPSEAKKTNMGSQRRCVKRDISCPTHTRLFSLHMDDGNRCLRRDSRGQAVPIPIKHDVAHDQ